MKNSTVFLIAACILSITCSDINNNKKINIEYKENTFEKQYGDCGSITSNCVEVFFESIEITNNVIPQIKDSITTAINSFLYLNPMGDDNLPGFDSLFSALVKSYKEIKNEFPESNISYSLERKVKVLTDTLDIFSLELTEFSYLGGAHPNHFKGFINFNLKDGNTITLNDLFTKKNLKELTRIAEVKFRQQKNLKADEDLQEAGYFFENSEFYLNENFLITTNGIKFYYNPYEIAPYAAGVTEVEISFLEIKRLIDSNTLLEDFIR